MKNKVAVLLMEAGVSYSKQKLPKVGYFRELLATNQDIDEGLRSLQRMCQETVVSLGKTDSALVRSLERDPRLRERIERLMTIPAGPILALTWALEVGDVGRFSSMKKAISYCGLCAAKKSSGDHATHAAVQATQPAFADHSDRGGQNGATTQHGLGHNL
jgi:transposase